VSLRKQHSVPFKFTRGSNVSSSILLSTGTRVKRTSGTKNNSNSRTWSILTCANWSSCNSKELSHCWNSSYLFVVFVSVVM
jgi:hypothetical protein